MAGIVPGTSMMQRARVRMGYVEAVALRDNPLAPAGASIRAHEFHWSCMDPPDPERAAYRADGDRLEGIVAGPAGNVLASYLHVHFGSDPRLAPRFVAACRAQRAAGVPR
jgi:cobyrinic acid a,c-diamide synthase